jgi:hypothetical protein
MFDLSLRKHCPKEDNSAHRSIIRDIYNPTWRYSFCERFSWFSDSKSAESDSLPCLESFCIDTLDLIWLESKSAFDSKDRCISIWKYGIETDAKRSLHFDTRSSKSDFLIGTFGIENLSIQVSNPHSFLPNFHGHSAIIHVQCFAHILRLVVSRTRDRKSLSAVIRKINPLQSIL